MVGLRLAVFLDAVLRRVDFLLVATLRFLVDFRLAGILRFLVDFLLAGILRAVLRLRLAAVFFLVGIKLYISY